MDRGRLHQVRQRARALVAHYDVAAPPVPVEDIIDGEGLRILRFHWGRDFRLDGLLVHNEQAIALNLDKPRLRQRFSLAHELGHYVLNHDYLKRLGPAVDLDHPPDDLPEPSDATEQEANAFANELLVPRPLLLHYRQPPAHSRPTDDAADSFGHRPFADLVRRLNAPPRRLTEAELARLFDVSLEVLVLALQWQNLL